jgi:carbamoyl-phosphate synthase large subunit
MRVLISSVGRRGYLVKFFKEALGSDGEVWGGDYSRYAPAFHCCDKSVLLPKVTDSDYVEQLIGFCQKNQIDVVVPLIDPELEVLAAHRERFYDAGIMVVVSPPQTVQIAFDKYLTYKFGKDSGIAVPETVVTIREAEELLAAGKLKWPVVVKPRKGSASADITYCHNERQMKNAFESCPNPMIQECMKGQEYGYDILGDRNCRPISVFCKRKLAMRAGETDKAVSTADAELIALGQKLAEKLPIFGPADVDVMVTDDGPKLLEINPRFGGGYPCSHQAGANFPAKLIAMCRNQRLTPDIGSCPAGVYMLKQYEIVFPSRKSLESIRDWRGESALKEQ